MGWSPGKLRLSQTRASASAWVVVVVVVMAAVVETPVAVVEAGFVPRFGSSTRMVGEMVGRGGGHLRSGVAGTGSGVQEARLMVGKSVVKDFGVQLCEPERARRGVSMGFGGGGGSGGGVE